MCACGDLVALALSCLPTRFEFTRDRDVDNAVMPFFRALVTAGSDTLRLASLRSYLFAAYLKDGFVAAWTVNVLIGKETRPSQKPL